MNTRRPEEDIQTTVICKDMHSCWNNLGKEAQDRFEWKTLRTAYVK